MSSSNGEPPEVFFDDGLPPATNYPVLARALAETGGIFRTESRAGGLIRVYDDGSHSLIERGADLAPLLADRIYLFVVKKVHKQRIGGFFSDTFQREQPLSEHVCCAIHAAFLHLENRNS